MDEIDIYSIHGQFRTTSFFFPGGELQVQIPDLPSSFSGDISVIARLQSSDALLRLIMASEIIGRNHHSGQKRLVIPYFPYARQDRVMQPREAFSLKAFAQLINGLDFDEVIVCDPHSDVTAALVDNIRIIPQVDLVRRHLAVQELVRDAKPVIVSPDAGAAKKALAVAHDFGLPLLTASKVRDTATGEITGTRVDAHEIAGHWTALIVDDICDGGRTFFELAKMLRYDGASRVYLYVTHGIFSKGLSVFDGLIDGIFTTDSFQSKHILGDQSVPVLISTINQKGIAHEN